MFTRSLELPKRSFFLFGPRATGKSTWLKNLLPEAFRIDLLRTETYFQLASKPQAFREQVIAQSPKKWIVVDEVQRLPSLLNEVHALIEDKGYRFALTGSSARKLKRGQANLLAGRASVKKMFPLIHEEYADSAPLDDVLRWGSLPLVLARPEERIEALEAYVGTYLREEIKEEALTRKVDAFARFLDVAALANAQVTNLASLSRDAHIPRSSLGVYFSILEDTLLGTFLPAWVPRARVKEVAHPKFYFFDTGVLRAIQGRLHDRPTDEEKGALLETYLFHELRACISYQNLGGDLFYWRTTNGVEVDFIWRRGARVVGIEVKASPRWRNEYDRSLLAFTGSKIEPSRCYGVYLGSKKLKMDWGVVLPFEDFLKNLGPLLTE